MPFLEFLGTMILLVIAVVVLGYALAAAGVIYFGILVAFSLLGWIPIMVCATDYHYSIGFGGSTWGTLAAISLIIYSAETLVLLVVAFVRPDPDNLPPGFKFLSQFYLVREKIRVSQKDFDAGQYAEAFNRQPKTIFGMRMMNDVYKRYQTMMHKRAAVMEEATEDYLNTVNDRAKAAERMARAKARQQAAEEWKKENE